MQYKGGYFLGMLRGLRFVTFALCLCPLGFAFLYTRIRVLCEEMNDLYVTINHIVNFVIMLPVFRSPISFGWGSLQGDDLTLLERRNLGVMQT